ncbi:MAG: class I SAM-dependent methyltransferase [Betaproteobacteria bacterium]|nr:class I SAM-dependent methyltransferase [Betaproteobacteria bacterium]
MSSRDKPSRPRGADRSSRARDERGTRPPAADDHQIPRVVAGTVPRIVLRPERERSLQRRHPWIFSGGVERVEGAPESGATVEVRSASGGFLGWAAYSPQSQILARVWDFHESARIDVGFFTARIRRAAEQRRARFGESPQGAVRLVHGEADGLPGVIVDRFAHVAVVQLTTAGAWRWRDAIADAIAETAGVTSVFERSDADVVHLEGLAPSTGPLRGDAPPGPVVIEENGVRFGVDVREGHKTGFYLDQRDNRALLRDAVKDRDVLDCFCYTGGFSLNALAGGAASVTSVDSSADALAVLRDQIETNGLPASRAQLTEADVFAQLRLYRDQARKFDVIVLDPPKFAPTAAAAERAARGYKDINLWAMKLLRPGGQLFTFSCSGGVSRDLFQKIVAGAAVDAGVDARVLRHLSAAPDHPVSLAFPEGEYLKGLVCEIV